MFSHIMVGVNDMQASRDFYDAVLSTMGHAPGVMDDKGRCLYITDTGIFALTKPINGEPAFHGNGCTIGFTAASPEIADKWHEVGLANGGTACENPPGKRESGLGDLYLAYLRDPAGNKLCALHLLG